MERHHERGGVLIQAFWKEQNFNQMKENNTLVKNVASKALLILV